MSAPPESGLREIGGFWGGLRWKNQSGCIRCDGQGDFTTPGGSESAAVLVPGSATFVSSHFGMVKRLPGPALTPKKCWELPRSANSPSKPPPGAGTRQVTPGDSGVAHSRHRHVPDGTNPSWVRPLRGNSRRIPALGMPGAGQSQDGNVEVRGFRGVLVPVTATQERKLAETGVKIPRPPLAAGPPNPLGKAE